MRRVEFARRRETVWALKQWRRRGKRRALRRRVWRRERRRVLMERLKEQIAKVLRGRYRDQDLVAIRESSLVARAEFVDGLLKVELKPYIEKVTISSVISVDSNEVLVS